MSSHKLKKQLFGYRMSLSGQGDMELVEERNIFFAGEHETQISENGEADLQTHFRGCMKNPQHKEFIPIEDLTCEHLPKIHREDDLYKYIIAVADLTVRVDVRLVSPKRPKVWPETNIPYPFYHMKNSTNMRTGSGSINGVAQFKDGVLEKYNVGHRKKLTKCWCKNCENSDSPSNVWWEFNVYTATHVVFDDIEASNTTLRLFYDNKDSPVIIVDKVSVTGANIKSDTCNLKCVTCDKNIGNRIKELSENCGNVFEKVLNKYFKSKDVVKFSFIVSHPHGCFKQVSVGQWKDKYPLNRAGVTRFTYTTSTCPGSSGANVHILGYNSNWLWCNPIVHSGSLRSGLNYSGAGLIR